MVTVYEVEVFPYQANEIVIAQSIAYVYSREDVGFVL